MGTASDMNKTNWPTWSIGTDVKVRTVHDECGHFHSAVKARNCKCCKKDYDAQSVPPTEV